jgi:formamidopyrimidine-DNA glycosylase
VPEIPDLEAIRHYLQPRLEGHAITATSAPLPWLVRTGAGDLDTLAGRTLGPVERTGKFLLFHVDDGRVLVVNPMLTGRFHWVETAQKARGQMAVVLSFQHGHDLRYSDERRMGRWYLVPGDALDQVPQFAKLAPDIMELDEDEFTRRLMARRGQIKSLLTNQEVVAGIGNAYSDEILWEARLHPHRRRASIDEEGVRELYRAAMRVLQHSIEVVRERAQAEGLGTKTEWREHLQVHRRAGEPCPRCGSEIRGQVRSGSETDYCLTCQPLFE